MLLAQSWQAAQRGDGGVTLPTPDLSRGRAVDVLVISVQVVVAGGAEQGSRRGQGARDHTSAVGVGGGLPERHWGWGWVGEWFKHTVKTEQQDKATAWQK